MESAVAIKFQFEDEIRRISVSEKSSWDELLIIAKDMFPQLEGFVLQYKDDEGSEITVRSDMEYQEARRVARAKNSSLFFTVTVPKPQFGRFGGRSCPKTPGRFGHFKKFNCPVFNRDNAEEQQTQQTESQEVHRFITCDGCQQTPLKGTRYHCLQCYDFDLCGSCYQKAGEGAQFLSHTADHPVVQINKPNCPRGRWGNQYWANICAQQNASQCVKTADTTTVTPTEEKKEPATETPVTNVTVAPAPAPAPAQEEQKEQEQVVVAVVEKTEDEKKTEEALKVMREMGLINGTTEEENLIELLKANNYDAATVIDIYFN